MSVIKIDNLTKDYGFKRGIFDVSFSIDKGEVLGYLGPNGAGKTTTIRHIMGFVKPEQGKITVDGLDSWSDSDKILKKVGYLPGEIALFESMTANEFLEYMARLRDVKDFTYMDYLIKYFDFDRTGRIKRMSLGNKRKLAVITAFMHDPEILILDEPTSGLDPVMQKRFIEFVISEKKRGKTILLSSHIFSEVDAVCDRIAIIKDGHIVSMVNTKEFHSRNEKTYKIEFLNEKDYQNFKNNSGFKVLRTKDHLNQVNVYIKDNEINELFTTLSELKIKYISEIKFTLEDYFMDFYDRTKSVEEGLSHVNNRNK